MLQIQADTAIYKDLLNNYICVIEEYNINLVIYLMEMNTTKFKEHAQAIQALSSHIHVVDFPYALYWSFVSEKTEKSKTPVNYEPIDITFKNVGFVVMIIPMLEILQLGFNVLYLDLDVVLMQNPFPYLIHSSAELIVSAELRTCKFDSSLIDSNSASQLTEFNTGMLFAKSNERTLVLFKKWLTKMFNQGIVNDQKALLMEELGGTQVFDCNPLLPKEVTDYYYDKIPTGRRTSAVNASVSSVRYCALNELLFQAS